MNCCRCVYLLLFYFGWMNCVFAVDKQEFCRTKKNGAYQVNDFEVTCKNQLYFQERRFYPDKKLLSLRSFRSNGHPQEQTRYYRNGKIETIQKFRENGILLYSKFHATDSKLKKESFFRNDASKEVKIYNGSGKLEKIQFFTAKNLDHEDLYNAEGKKIETKYYDKNNKLTETKKDQQYDIDDIELNELEKRN